MKTQDIEYSVGGKRYVGYFAVDGTRQGRRPGVLVAPEGEGLIDLTRSIARRLAEAGYAAFAMDYYGDGKVLKGRSEAMAYLEPWMADPTGIREIATAALAALTAQKETDPHRLAAIGYCYGGVVALELGRSGAALKAIVGFHAGLQTARPDDAANIQAKVLVCMGADDPVIPAARRQAFEQEMTKGGVDWRMNLYGGAGHSFTNPAAAVPHSFINPGDAPQVPGFGYNEAADRHSWAAMMDLLAEALGPV